MSNPQLTAVIFVLLVLVGLAQLLGYVFVKLRQPKVVGEILAGVVLGPALLGRLPFVAHVMGTARHNTHILSFVYWLGLLLLMFVSGAEMQQLFGRGERRTVSWLVIVGTGIPFLLGLIFAPHLITPSLAGPHGNRVSLIIILAVGVAVTSVPVVSKIFADLNILDTRFARLILGVAVLEDIVLWLALAIATSIAAKSHLNPWQMSLHLLVTVAYFGLGLTVVPRLIKRLNTARWNALARHSPTGYAIAVLLAYCAAAGALDVNLVFAAFLAGFALVHRKRRIFDDSIDAISKVAFAFFIPVYFAIVGLKLDLIRGVSLPMIVVFIVATCAVKMASVALAGRFAGFRGLDLINLGITTNARGGPGIVLASVAFDAGIISSKFYTTLVVAAVLTSQFAGAWLDHILRKGWPLLKSDVANEPVQVVTPPAPTPA
ncbi:MULTISPECIES: cation:proton antiporter [unclassified Mycobacterium]|uniref:cation:proton antiporter n=1 Tax=unclassified Mycobacterium TaxID=2642494 RepID=UPI0007FE0DF7|nr:MULTISPECIES: cation:proton antiporter [unclassified Mycobacterium]OBH03069.1 sodium:proton exchanger [Mycobacterium sp. E2699]OBI49013.1 sodium:proton exchanger [Mycobacterium sp. E787]